MSYSSYHRLPTIKSFADAAKRLSNTTPLRRGPNSSFTIYPLSERRYGRLFSIRMVGDADSLPNSIHYAQAPGAQDGDIELLLWHIPLITFHKPRHGENGEPIEETTIASPNYWSLAMPVFLQSVLYGYINTANTNRGRLVLETCTPGSKDDKVVVAHKGSVRLRRMSVEDRHYLVRAEADANTVLRINRKKSNEVRARYGEFYRYMKGMLGVRKEGYEQSFYNYAEHRNIVTVDYKVTFTSDEVRSVVPHEPFGVTMRYDPRFITAAPFRKPAKITIQYVYDERTKNHVHKPNIRRYQDWLACTEEFLALVKNGQDAEAFYKAFVWLGFYGCMAMQRYGTIPSPERDLVVDVDTINSLMDEIIFKYHSEEVIESVPAKPGTIPSVKYETWVTRELG